MSDDPKWYLRYDGRPPEGDDGAWIWNRALHRWVPDNEHDESELSMEEEDAIERAYFRRQKRIEWEIYHPGEPCPECEVEG